MEKTLFSLRADHYCRDLLNMDDQILTVVVVDEHGRILAMDWRDGKVPWEGQGIEASKSFEAIQENLGLWMKVVIGLAEQTSPLIGAVERATFVHRKFQLVLFGSPSTKNAIGLMLGRSANVDHIASKVREILG